MLKLLQFLFACLTSGLSFGQYFAIKDLGWEYSASSISGTIALVNTSETDFEIHYLQSDDVSVLTNGVGSIILLKPGQCIILNYISKILHHRFADKQEDFLCNYYESLKKDQFKIPVRINAISADTILDKYRLYFNPDLNYLNYVWKGDLPCLVKDSTLSRLNESLDSLFIDPELCELTLTTTPDGGHIILGDFVLRNPTKNRYMINSIVEETTGGQIFLPQMTTISTSQDRRLHPHNFMALRFRLENPEKQLLEKISTANARLNFILEVEGDSGMEIIQITYEINKSNLVISYMNGAKKETWL